MKMLFENMRRFTIGPFVPMVKIIDNSIFKGTIEKIVP